MKVRRFTARTARAALVMVRESLGEDAVVLSTQPCAEGVEVLAMAPEDMRQIALMAASPPEPVAPITPVVPVVPVADSVAPPSMSTLSFQDYVRERMLRRQPTPASGDEHPAPRAHTADKGDIPVAPDAARPARPLPAPTAPPGPDSDPEQGSVLEQRMNKHRVVPVLSVSPPLLRQPPVLHDAVPFSELMALRQPGAHPDDTDGTDVRSHASAVTRRAHRARRQQDDMMSELRSMRGLIEERFSALAFIERLNRQPAQARLTKKLLDCSFSPVLIRKLGDSLPMDVADEAAWAAGVLERNLITAEHEAPLEDQGGVFALIGPTGVGKTTTTAKIAAAFAARYGAAHLGLITLDAYRIGAHEQLRAYGRILGVPVHTAHDRASLEDLLALLGAKKMVLIDTAGMAQRDTRTRELLDMLDHRSIRPLLVVNAASQGETIEDVMISYRASQCCGVVLSKVDEAVKLGPALDALIRHKLKLIGVADGQRVPEDWQRPSANALMQRAMCGGGSCAYQLDPADVSLIFTAPLAPVHPDGVPAKVAKVVAQQGFHV